MSAESSSLVPSSRSARVLRKALNLVATAVASTCWKQRSESWPKVHRDFPPRSWSPERYTGHKQPASPAGRSYVSLCAKSMALLATWLSATATAAYGKRVVCTTPSALRVPHNVQRHGPLQTMQPCSQPRRRLDSGRKKDPGVPRRQATASAGLGCHCPPDPPQAFTPYQEQLPGYASPKLQVFLCGVKYKPRNGVQKEISPRTETCSKKEESTPTEYT